jgi:peroxiredoxin
MAAILTIHIMDNTSEIAFRVGEPMPEFSLPMVAGESASTCTLDSLRGKAFVLFVYPKDATCGCTLEAQGFRDLHEEFAALDVQVLGLSRDTIGAHKKFIAAQSFPFSLLADSKQEYLKRWGLIYEAKMYGKPVTKVRRTTVLNGADGVIQRVWQSVEPVGHAVQVLEACRELARS